MRRRVFAEISDKAAAAVYNAPVHANPRTVVVVCGGGGCCFESPQGRRGGGVGWGGGAGWRRGEEAVARGRRETGRRATATTVLYRDVERITAA